jgi:hypothetical protein
MLLDVETPSQTSVVDGEESLPSDLIAGVREGDKEGDK